MIAHVGAQENRPDLRALASKVIGRLEGVGAGHLDVQQHDVRPGLPGLGDQPIGAWKRPDVLEVPLELEPRGETVDEE